MLVSAIDQHGSVIGIYMSPPSWASLPPPIPSHPSRLSQSPDLSSLSHRANSHWLSIFHGALSFVPPSPYWPPPAVSVSLFSTCASPLKALVAQSGLTLRPQGLEPTRILCPWNSPGKNTGAGCHSLLKGLFPTQGLSLGPLPCRQILYRLSRQGSVSIVALQIGSSEPPF